jgi:hypothetical protein
MGLVVPQPHLVVLFFLLYMMALDEQDGTGLVGIASRLERSVAPS